MHNNCYFLKQLTHEMRQSFIGLRIVACFSQEKDELIIIFSNGQTQESNIFLKAILTSQFSSLSFPDSFYRARTNSVNLFPEIIGEQVTEIVQHENERSFYLQLTNNKALLFKLFGTRSNVIYFQQETPVVLFHKKFPKDFSLSLSGLNRQFEPDKEEFRQQLPAPEKLYPTFGDLPSIYLKANGYDLASPEQKWEMIQLVKEKLEQASEFYIVKINNQTRLSLLPLGEIRYQVSSPISCLNHFVSIYLAEFNFEKNYRDAYTNLTRQLEAALAYLKQAKSKWQALQKEASYSQTADVIMANLHIIPERAESVMLYDFYQDKERLFKLKTTESPQRFAERLYKKSKNQQIEINLLKERIQNKEEQALQLEIAIQELTNITDYKNLKAFLKSHTVAILKPQAPAEEPFRVFNTEGYKIMVGKSAKNNDVLTQQFTFKEDLWLHAKDVAGSHVVIKYQAGKIFPNSVIHKAAQLAAFYSKRKTDSLCPVLYTPKKFVRKPKGAAPGQVVVEREKVVLVKPENPFEKTFG